MSTEKLVKGVAEQIERRRFLKKTGAAVIGGLMALMGLPQTALASCSPGLNVAYCCCLCKPNSGSCGSCACVWCWSCQWIDGYWYRCCECHSQSSTCSGCNDVTCSWSSRIGVMPASGPVR